MIDQQSYDYICFFLKKNIGLDLDTDKQYLIETRLVSIIEKFKLKNFRHLVDGLKDGNIGLIHDVLDEMTTNESLFFRDEVPFEVFKSKLLPEIVDANRNTQKVMIWSAAASTGQEAYSISMIIDELYAHYKGWDFKIIGTDFSDKALERARQGEYSEFEVKRGLKDHHKDKYFTCENNQWKVIDRIKDRVEFRHLNIIDDYGYMETFDIIFCRNVLIYFDIETKKTVVASLKNHLKPEGYFVLGSAETMMGISDDFVSADDRTSIYKKI